MFNRKASSAIRLRRNLLRCCALMMGAASYASVMAADAAYRYLDENGRPVYSQYPPSGVSVKKVYTNNGSSQGTPRPRYGDESRYSAARQDASPQLERKQAKIAAEAKERKRVEEIAAECRRNHEIGCRNLAVAATER